MISMHGVCRTSWDSLYILYHGDSRNDDYKIEVEYDDCVDDDNHEELIW